MQNIHAVTFNLHSICMQVYLVVFFKLQLMLKIILHLITCRIIWMLRRMKKGNSNQPVSIHQDHLDNVAPCKPAQSHFP